MSKPQEVITFKVDKETLQLMEGIRNRSEFIRTAILAALDSVCPFCKGSGILTPSRKEHWKEFAQTHQMEECGDCHEMTLVCKD